MAACRSSRPLTEAGCCVEKFLREVWDNPQQQHIKKTRIIRNTSKKKKTTEINLSTKKKGKKAQIKTTNPNKEVKLTPGNFPNLKKSCF